MRREDIGERLEQSKRAKRMHARTRVRGQFCAQVEEEEEECGDVLGDDHQQPTPAARTEPRGLRGAKRGGLRLQRTVSFGRLV